MFNKLRIQCGLAGASALLAASALYADTISDVNDTLQHPGFYAGIQAGLAGYSPPAGSSFSQTLFPTAFAPGVLAGYQFNENFALQGSFNYYDSRSSSGYTLQQGNTSVFVNAPDSYKLYGGDIAGKFIYPVSSRFNAYGLLGLALNHEYSYNVPYANASPTVDQSLTKIMPEVGVGGEIYLNKTFSLSISVIYTLANSINEIVYVPIGITAHF